MTRSLLCAAALVLLAACSSDAGEGAQGQDALSPSPSASEAAPAGESVPRCEQVVREGAPVNSQVVTNGCVGEEGKAVQIQVTECPDGRRVAVYEGLGGEVGGGTWKRVPGSDACAA